MISTITFGETFSIAYIYRVSGRVYVAHDKTMKCGSSVGRDDGNGGRGVTVTGRWRAQIEIFLGQTECAHVRRARPQPVAWAQHDMPIAMI